MNLERKGELALRIYGLALIAQALCRVRYFYYAAESIASFDHDVRIGLGLWVQAVCLALPPLFGICLLSFLARPVSRMLFRGTESPGDSGYHDAIHIGVALAVVWLVQGIFTLPALLALVEPVFLVVLLPCAIGVCVIAQPRRLRSFLSGCAFGWRNDSADNAKWLGTAFVIMAVVMLMAYSMRFIGIVLAYVSDVSHPIARQAIRVGIIDEAFGALLAVALMLESGRLAALLTPRKDEGGSARSGFSLDNATEYFFIAVCLACAYVFFHYVLRLVQSPFHSWRGPAAVGALLYFLAVPTGVAFAIFFVAGRFAPRIAATFSRQPMRPLDANIVVPSFQIGLTIIALHFAKWHLSLASAGRVSTLWSWRTDYDSSMRVVCLLAFLWCMLSLVIKGDLAWLLCRTPRSCDARSKTEFAALLRPWLVLLGVWTVMPALPHVIGKLVEKITCAVTRTVPRVDADFLVSDANTTWGAGLVLVFGLVLIFGARPLARFLSFGRLLPHVWRTSRLQDAHREGMDDG